MATEVHVGDPTVFAVTLTDNGSAVNITGATIVVYFRGPTADPTTSSVSGSVVSGAGGTFTATATTSTFHAEGKWEMQAYVTISGSTWHSTIHKFSVTRNLG